MQAWTSEIAGALPDCHVFVCQARTEHAACMTWHLLVPTLFFFFFGRPTGAHLEGVMFQKLLSFFRFAFFKCKADVNFLLCVLSLTFKLGPAVCFEITKCDIYYIAVLLENATF